MAANPGTSGLDPRQSGRRQISQVHHTVGAEATNRKQRGFVAQHVAVGDRLPAVGEHHRDISKHLAPVVVGHK